MSERFARAETALRATLRARLSPQQMETLRSVMLAWMPPAVLGAIRRMRSEWEYAGSGPPDPAGWDAAAVARAYRDGLAGIRQAIAEAGPLGVPLEPVPDDVKTATDPGAHALAMTFGYVLARAAAGRDRLSVLDWGGGGGGYGLLAGALLPDVKIDYHVAELPAVVDACASPNRLVVFHTGEEWRTCRYDIVVASGALQYASDWQETLTAFADVADRYVFLARVLVTPWPRPFVLRQTPTRYGYDTSYSGWVFSRDALLAQASDLELVLAREFLADEAPSVPNAPAPILSRSFLFVSLRSGAA